MTNYWWKFCPFCGAEIKAVTCNVCNGFGSVKGVVGYVSREMVVDIQGDVTCYNCGGTGQIAV